MYFSKKYNFFRHLMLEIALAIPASKGKKNIWNNTAGQGFKIRLCVNHANVYSNIIILLKLT